jgi:hypothetical protein
MAALSFLVPIAPAVNGHSRDRPPEFSLQRVKNRNFLQRHADFADSGLR